MLTKMTKLLVTLVFAPSLCLAEIVHTAHASMCLSSATAHTTCVSSHSSSDADYLEFKCELRREGLLRDWEYETFGDDEELGSSGQFTSTLNAALTGSESVWYCGYNHSRYWLDPIIGSPTVILGQNSGQECVNYRGGTGGGPDPY